MTESHKNFHQEEIEHLKGYQAMYVTLYQLTEYPKYEAIAQKFGEAIKLVEDFAKHDKGTR